MFSYVDEIVWWLLVKSKVFNHFYKKHLNTLLFEIQRTDFDEKTKEDVMNKYKDKLDKMNGVNKC